MFSSLQPLHFQESLILQELRSSQASYAIGSFVRTETSNNALP